MGRRIPPYSDVSRHPAVSFSLIATCVAAIVIVIAALCGAKSRSRSPTPSRSQSRSRSRKHPAIASHSSAENENKANAETEAGTEETSIKLPSPSPSQSPTPTPEAERNNINQVQQQLPLTLALKAKEKRQGLTIRTQRRTLSANLSLKLGGMGLSRLSSRKEELQRKPMKLKHEDSIWTKTILLGERCRVPDEDGAIFYDERGNRLSAYPVRTPRSLPVSRSNSFIDKDSPPL